MAATPIRRKTGSSPSSASSSLLPTSTSSPSSFSTSTSMPSPLNSSSSTTTPASAEIGFHLQEKYSTRNSRRRRGWSIQSVVYRTVLCVAFVVGAYQIRIGQQLVTLSTTTTTTTTSSETSSNGISSGGSSNTGTNHMTTNKRATRGRLLGSRTPSTTMDTSVAEESHSSSTTKTMAEKEWMLEKLLRESREKKSQKSNNISNNQTTETITATVTTNGTNVTTAYNSTSTTDSNPPPPPPQQQQRPNQKSLLMLQQEQKRQQLHRKTRNMAIHMKDGTWLVDDLDDSELPRCGRFKCFVKSKNHVGFGYTISQHFRSLKKDQTKHSKYDRRVMKSTYEFVKQLSTLEGFEQFHHTYPLNLPPKYMEPSKDLLEFMTHQMTIAKQLVRQYDKATGRTPASTKRKKKQKESESLKMAKNNATNIDEDGEEVDDNNNDVRDDQTNTDDDNTTNDDNPKSKDDDEEEEEEETATLLDDDDDNDIASTNSTGVILNMTDIPELVLERKRIKGYRDTKHWLVQPLMMLPEPETSFTFRYLDDLQRQNRTKQVLKGIEWVRSNVVVDDDYDDNIHAHHNRSTTMAGVGDGDDDDDKNPSLSALQPTSPSKRLNLFSTTLQSQTVLTLKLLWEVESRVNADFQVWITTSGDIWHYDLDRIYGSSPRQIQETEKHQPSFEFVKFVKTILKELNVTTTPILDEYYNNNVHLVLNATNTTTIDNTTNETVVDETANSSSTNSTTVILEAS